jgi:hypothetical protein
MKHVFLLWLVLLHLPLLSQQDTARVMYYNLLNFPGTTPERVAHFRVINQYVNPDILLVNELLNEEGANSLLNDGLNVFGSNQYERATFTNGPDSDNLLFYKHDKFTLYSQDTIQTDLRHINEYVLFYNSPGLINGEDTTFLYLYSAHLKSSTGSTNRAKRLAEVMQFKAHVNSKPEISNLFFGGDLNLYSSSEPAYDTLINYGLFPLTDVLPAGSWQDDPAFANIHTQSTRTLQFGGGAKGGLDDRFDFILFSEDIINGSNNINYIPNSMQAVGNDGNHLNLSILDDPINTSVPDSVLQALYSMTDHLPVICDIEIEYSIPQPAFDLDLKVFLEGPFEETLMNPKLNNANQLPLSQPFYNSPWNYNGDETVSSIPNPEVIDWILVELRDTTEAALATGATNFARKAGFILSNGDIVDIDGTSPLQFGSEGIGVDNKLFVVLWHRNHLGIMSASEVLKNGNTYSFDFTDAATKVYGAETGHKLLGNGIWGMMAGDSNADGYINSLDKDLWALMCGLKGYLEEDLNLDKEVNNSDKNDFWLINDQKSSKVPE